MVYCFVQLEGEEACFPQLAGSQIVLIEEIFDVGRDLVDGKPRRVRQIHMSRMISGTVGLTSFGKGAGGELLITCEIRSERRSP